MKWLLVAVALAIAATALSDTSAWAGFVPDENNGEWLRSLAWALEDLRPAQRHLLAKISQASPQDLAACRPQGAGCPLGPDMDNWQRELRIIAMHLAGLGGWKAAALASLTRGVPRSIPTKPEEVQTMGNRARLNELSRRLRDMIVGKDDDGTDTKPPTSCKKARARLLTYVKTGADSVLFAQPGAGEDRECLRAAQKAVDDIRSKADIMFDKDYFGR